MRHVVPSTLSLLLGTVSVVAQTYPTKPVVLVEPFAVGTTADIGGRIIAEHLTKKLGQRFAVENVPGALGRIGIDQLLGRGSDGYNLCYCNDGSVVTVPASYLSMGETPPYSVADFTPIGQTVEIRFALAVRKDLPVTNLQELVAYARAKGVVMGAPSPMAIIITSLLKSLVGDGVVETRYGRGGEPAAMTDMLGGSVQVMVASTNTLLPQAQVGAVRIIGAIGPRNPFIPDVPTLGEQQTPETAGFVRTTEQLMPWNGIIGPKGLPPEVVRTVSTALKATLADPEVLAALRRARLVVLYSDPEEFAALIRRRMDAVTIILRDSQIRLR